MPAATAHDAGGRAGAETLRRAAREIAEIGADVVLLQEVDRILPRSGRLDQAAVLADELGVRHRHAASLVLGPGGAPLPAPRSNVPRRGYGVALLTRLPVNSWHVKPLRGGMSDGRVDAGRVLLAAVLRAGEGPVTVGVTHLGVISRIARRQLASCVAAMSSLPGPRLIGGDLNLGPAAVSVVVSDAGYAGLVPALTFTNARPRRQLDHLLGSGLVAARPGQVHHLSVSDHAGLSVEVESE